MVIPAGLYTERHLDEEKLDRTGEFISTCGSNHFNIDTSREGFCRDSVFSITAAHNIGALPCMCDYAGSASFECEKFGGQCKCKENIIGRQCTACKSGYYGFPECKPCNCPSTAYCEPQTGKFLDFVYIKIDKFCKKRLLCHVNPQDLLSFSLDNRSLSSFLSLVRFHKLDSVHLIVAFVSRAIEVLVVVSSSFWKTLHWLFHYSKSHLASL